MRSVIVSSARMRNSDLLWPPSDLCSHQYCFQSFVLTDSQPGRIISLRNSSPSPSLSLDLDLAIMVRFGAAASALQKAAASYSSRKIGTVTCQCAAARLTSTSSPSPSWNNPPRRQLSSESAPSLQDRGIMDSNDLLQFNTLHELQKNSSEAFGSNPLFGTHNGKEEGGEFEWMTYEEWGRKVDACRTVLKDTCGEFAFGALLE